MESNMNVTKLEGKTIKEIQYKKEHGYSASETLVIKFTDESEFTIESVSWEASALLLKLT